MATAEHLRPPPSPRGAAGAVRASVLVLFYHQALATWADSGSQAVVVLGLLRRVGAPGICIPGRRFSRATAALRYCPTGYPGSPEVWRVAVLGLIAPCGIDSEDQV